MKAKAFDTKVFKRIMVYTAPYRKLYYGVIFWAVALSAVAAARPWAMGAVIRIFLEHHRRDGLELFCGGIVILLFLEVFAQFYFVYLANKLGQDIVRDIRVKLFNHMLKFRMKYFDLAPVGQLVTRTVSDIESIARIFSQGLFMILSDLLKMAVVLIVIFVMNWKLAWIPVAVMPFLLYVTRIFQRKMQVAFEEVRTQVAAINTFVQERVTGMKIVQLFTREEVEAQKFSDINQKHNVAWIKTILYNSIFFPIADIVSSFTVAFVVWHGGLLIALGDTTTQFSELATYTMFIGMLFNPLRQIADKFNEMQMGMIAANRVFDILDTEDQIQDVGQVEAPDFKGHITFENVHFGYNPDEEIIKGISFHVEPGQTVAIVGATGAGKSTIINLLNRFYELNSGRITIEGEDIRNYRLDSLRRQIAVVLQDVFLFADTIYNNITLYDESITMEQVVSAARKIGVHDFIMNLPNGYHYNVKERGVMLSSGQRQLIAFLRAYVSNPGILILDEATSSVDTHTEELIQNATERLTEGRTSIVIAHRLATIVKADKILVMDKGLVIEEGSHAELLNRTEGVYKNLYYAQYESERMSG